MRILLVNYEYPPVGGGGGVAADNVVRALVRRGHEVDYVTTWFRGFARHEVIEGVHVYREPVAFRKDLHTATIVSMLTYPPVAVRRGLALARTKEYDLVHTHFAIPSGPAGYVLSKWLRVPHVLSIHGGDIYDPSKRYSPHRNALLGACVRRILGQASVIVGQSRDTCRRVAELYSPATPIRRIPLGFVEPRFEPATREQLGLTADKLYAIAVSRLIPRKDYETLLRALAQADVPELHLLILGDGPEEGAMRGLAAELGIASRVTFLGRQSDEQKFQYLSASDFFVLSPLHEGYGIVFQEAMWCGLPIATTNVGGQTDFLRPGENALLSDPREPAGLARSLVSLARDASLRSHMREVNLRDIQGQMVDAVAIEHERLFEQVLAGTLK